MVETAQMPKSIQSDIPVDAIGEALLQHYNVGITNPWFEAGYSDQETYNRRKLPWAGKTYNVDEDGNVSGTNVDELPSGLTDQWSDLADAARSVLKGNDYDNLEDLYERGLTEVGSQLRD